MYKCRYFQIKELVPPQLLKYNESKLWLLFDERLLKAIDSIREKYGSIYINSTSAGLTQCGFRLSDTKTGALFSQHKYGRAADLHIMSIESQKLSKTDKVKAYDNIRQELLSDFMFDSFNFEDGIHWLHIDLGNRPKRLFLP